MKAGFSLLPITFLFGLFLGSCQSEDKSLARLAFAEGKLVGYAQSEFYGCFGSGKYQVIIADSSGVRRAVYISDEERKIVDMNPEREAAFSDFFKDIRNAPKTDCMTTLSKVFVAKFGNLKVRREDLECDWHGFEQLTSAIFGK